ncbi:MAG: recombinase family protein [Defluviicoccus sp.]
MLIGYSRTSTIDQTAGLQAQIRDLQAAGCERIFSEQVSSVAPERPELARGLDMLRPGDALVITRLDRLARSVADLVRIVDELRQRQAGLRILTLGIDTVTPSGQLVVQIFGAIAQFERALMLERQREGIAKARSEGRYKGRRPTAREKAGQIQALKDAGKGPTEIARELGIGRASVYRVLGEEPGSR